MEANLVSPIRKAKVVRKVYPYRNPLGWLYNLPISGMPKHLLLFNWDILFDPSDQFNSIYGQNSIAIIPHGYMDSVNIRKSWNFPCNKSGKPY